MKNLLLFAFALFSVSNISNSEVIKQKKSIPELDVEPISQVHENLSQNSMNFCWPWQGC